MDHTTETTPATPEATAADAIAADAPKPDDDARVADLEQKLREAEADRARLNSELRRARQPRVDVDALAEEMHARLAAEIEALPESVLEILREEEERKARAAAKTRPAEADKAEAGAADAGSTVVRSHKRMDGESREDHARRLGMHHGAGYSFLYGRK